VRGQRDAPAALTPGKEPVPIVLEAGWAPGPVWTGAKNLAPPGFDTRTVQLAASSYTDYATRPTTTIVTIIIIVRNKSRRQGNHIVESKSTN